jgi:hypothetical protein
MAKVPNFDSRQDPVVIRGYSARVKALANQAEVRFQVISAVRLNDFDPGGREHRIGDATTVRLDRQANTSDGSANLQLQVNDAALARIRLNQHEGTTIAQVLVPAAVFRTAFACPDVGVRTHLENVVRAALLKSYESMGFQFTVVQK